MNSNAVIASVPVKSEPADEEPLTEQQTVEQPANMANQQAPENNRSVSQLKLFLNYSTRDHLIGNLNDLSTILKCNEPIPEDAKRRTCKKIEESVGLLVKLSPFEPTPPADDSSLFEERISARLTLELSVTEQLRMVAHLVDNRIAVLTYDKVTDEAKRSLITENKRMIVQLMELPREEPSDLVSGARLAEDSNEDANEDANEDTNGDEETNDNGEPPSKKQRSR